MRPTRLCLIAVWTLVGCASGPTLKPVVSSVTWHGKGRERIVEAIEASLVSTGHSAQVVNDSQVRTDWSVWYTPEGVEAKYRLDIRLQPTPDGSVAARVAVDKSWTAPPGRHVIYDHMTTQVNDEIAKRLERVFADAQRRVGTAVGLEREVLSWPPEPRQGS